MSTWGTVYELERARAPGNDPESLRKRIRDLEREHDDYVVRANANVCELNQEIDRLRTVLTDIAEFCSGDGSPLGAIKRLVVIHNTAEQALRGNGQSAQGSKE